MIRRSLSVAIVLLAGCSAEHAAAPGDPDAQTARDAGKIAAALNGLTPGRPVSCIQQARIRDMKKFTNTILYEYSPREIYRVATTPGCNGLRYGDIVISRTTTGQLCRGDIIRTAAPNGAGPTGTCALGSFVPYRR